ncbi:MAG: UDP-N-acetylmuramoyl-tripeptide--D-alanyl-D-alanine ligase [Clostridia bacterium]|nr:UDP-N-acetylmuramoyl-tripeptide--D-alanyl-D-alanine ligase [Clostridia bacterium]
MLNINEIVKACNGRLYNGDGNFIPKSYEIDSREIKSGDFFIPLIGENTDGHCYIIDCVKKNVSGFFISSKYDNKEKIIEESKALNPNVCIIEVEDTLKALVSAGKYNREKHRDIPIVAITGSVGKTSTREMVASILSQKYTTLVTKKNYNSNIGISIMCLLIDCQEVCILEAGIDKFDEMEELSELLKPDVVVITLIGTSHIGTFKTQENIFSEKLKLTNHIKGISKVITNGDDKYLSTLTSNNNYDVIKVSIDNVGNIITGEDYLKFVTTIYNEKLEVKVNQIGNHNIYNTLMGIKVGETFNVSKEDIIRGIADYKNFVGRMQKNTINGITLIDDTYNASNESMRSGLITVYNLTAKRKIAVLGDMFDLGENANEIHKKLASIFDIVNYNYIYTLGDKMKLMAKEAGRYMDETHIKCFDERDKLVAELIKEIREGDVVYFKASNGMKFTTLYNEIERMLEQK